MDEDSYLQTTPQEELAIEELRSRTAHIQLRVRLLNDAARNEKLTLLRYLRARDCDVGKALEMMEATARFRATYCLDDEALGGWRPPQALLEGATPGGPDGLQRWRTSPPSPGFFSLDGSPVYYNRIGQIDPETLLRSVTVYDLVMRNALTLQNTLDTAAAKGLREGRPVTFKVIIVQDLAGLCRKHVHKLGFRASGEIAKVGTNHFPETLRAVYLVNVPAIFSLIWSLIKHLFDERVREKVAVISGDPAPFLRGKIAPEHLPVALGGLARGEGGDDYCWPLIARGGPVREELHAHAPAEAFDFVEEPPAHVLANRGQLVAVADRSAPATTAVVSASREKKPSAIRRMRKASAKLTGARHFFSKPKESDAPMVIAPPPPRLARQPRQHGESEAVASHRVSQRASSARGRMLVLTWAAALLLLWLCGRLHLGN